MLLFHKVYNYSHLFAVLTLPEHWWLTGFKLGEFSTTDSLTMDVKIVFPNQEMCEAFTGGLRAIGYQRKEFSVRGRRVTVHYTKPHSSQTFTRNPVQEALVQQTNENNCKLYETNLSVSISSLLVL